MAARLEIHFEGDLVEDHRVTLRTLGKTLNHLQSAIDRAHLDVKHGNVWKHARLKAEDYQPTDFLLNYPRKGGFVLDMVSETGDAILKKIRTSLKNALKEAMDEGVEESVRLKTQAEDQYNQVAHKIRLPRKYREFQQNAGEEMRRAYGERSIAKEFDQIFSLIRKVERHGSSLTLTIEVNNRKKEFKINNKRANDFHRVVSRRDLGEPVIYRGVLRSLDKGNNFSGIRGKFKNSESRREVTIHIANEQHFDQLHPYLQGNQKISIVAAPVIEYGSFDPVGGDIFYIGMLEAIEDAGRRARQL